MTLPPHFIDEKKKEVLSFISKVVIQSLWQFLLLCNLSKKVSRGLLVDVKRPFIS
tara:strand:- start:512 stop:676 length:165 start_codon:yes stop_codon:yes gene_type:complete